MSAPPSRPHRPRRSLRDDAGDVSLTEMLHLRDYWRTVRKRIWTLVTAFCLIVGSVVVVTLLTPAVYQASASLQIDSQPRGYGDINAMGEFGSGQYLIDQEYYQTQHRKLRARVQAQAVIDRLGLAEHEDFRDLENPVEALQTVVAVEPVAKTRLVWVYVSASSADLAQQICQAWTEVFVERNLAEIKQGVEEALAWIRREKAKAEDDLRKSEDELREFRRINNQIIMSTDEKGHVAQAQIEQLSVDQAKAESELARRQAEYDALAAGLQRESDPDRVSRLIASPLMEELRGKRSLLVTELSALENDYGEKYPKVVDARSRLADIDRQIAGEAKSELGRRRAIRDEAEREVIGIESRIGGVTSDALASNGPQGQYNLLRRAVEAKSRTYDELVAREQELTVAVSLKENNIRIIDTALSEPDPTEPNYMRNIAIAIAAGLLAGVSLALFFDYMDTTIKTREEVEALGVPFLGIIPSVPGLAGEGWEMARERYLYSYKYPKSAFSEFVRNIRTTVNFSAREDGKPPRRLLVTSAGPREGKTTSSINLGISFASTGKRVCLVDADLRRPSLHHAFGLDNEHGFSTLMSGEDEVAAVVQPTPQDGLFILPSGPRPPNPAEILGSESCTTALDKLNAAFDLVIIDSPPVVAVTDAVVLSEHVDGVIMVVKSFKVARDLVLQAKRQLTDVDARLIGVILNDFDIQRKSYGYYYYYTYYGAEREDVAKVRK